MFIVTNSTIFIKVHSYDDFLSLAVLVTFGITIQTYEFISFQLVETPGLKSVISIIFNSHILVI